MKKYLGMLLGVFFAVHLMAIGVRAEAPDISALSAVLMDADTGQVLYDKNMTQKMYPASTTKIMTGILTVENSYPGEKIVVTKSAVDISEPGSSNIALVSGEEINVSDAMYALMLPSANDAANVLAEHIGGTQEEFAKMMTQKAHMTGAVNTNFTNAHGLHDDGHYTTAYDLALITRYAMDDQRFMRYFGEQLYTMPATNKQPQKRYFTNYHYMLVKSSRYYSPDVIGGKVGYTTEAQSTISTVARRDGRTLICVLLHDGREQKFIDTKNLFEYGFSEFSPVTVDSARIPEFSVPVKDSGQTVGSATFRALKSATFLLHNTLSADDITILPQHPEAFEKDGKIEAGATFFVVPDDATLPPLLGTVKLPSSVTLDGTTYSADIDGIGQGLPAIKSGIQEKFNSNKLILPLLLSGIALIFISIFSMRYHIAVKRRKARLARLARRGSSYSGSWEK